MRQKFDGSQPGAEVVNFIFDQYILGQSLGGIVKLLEEKQIMSPTGNPTWGRAAITVTSGASVEFTGKSSATYMNLSIVIAGGAKADNVNIDNTGWNSPPVLISSALFGGAWWVAPSAYFIGIAAIIVSGIMLKKTRLFSGDPAPFVMELPAYHLPTFSNILRSMWERGSSFIKKAGTIILLSAILIWAGSCFGFVDGAFLFDPEMELEASILGILGGAISWVFSPLGFGEIRATVATIMGLVAKEEVVAVFGVLDFEGMTQLAAYSFLVFNLLCAPCFAAIGAIKREMNSAKWTWFAIGYQCVFAYAISLVIYQLGMLFTGVGNVLGSVVAFLILALILFLLCKPYSEGTPLRTKEMAKERIKASVNK